MHLNHGKLELIYIPREPLSCPEQPRKAQWPAWHHCLPGGLRKTPSNRLNSPPPPFPQPGNFLLTRLRNKKGALGGAAGAPQGLVPVLPGAGEASPSWAARAGLAGLGGQRLLTCLMVRFPSSIQPARGCSHCAAPGSAQIHQVSHRKQVFPPLLLPDFFFLLLIFPPPFLSFAGGGRDSS